MTIKCLLFDCDGTLVDSEELCKIALQQKFRELGIELDLKTIHHRFAGWQLSKILAILSEENSITLPEDFIEGYRAVLEDIFERELRPVTGIEKVLQQLDYPMAVVSNAPIAKIKHVLGICKLDHFFDGKLYSAYELNAWKPDPALYLHAAKDMGFKATQCAVIEDGIVGVKAGVNAGMRTYYYNPGDQAIDITDAHSFASMPELPSLLAKV